MRHKATRREMFNSSEHDYWTSLLQERQQLEHSPNRDKLMSNILDRPGMYKGFDIDPN